MSECARGEYLHRRGLRHREEQLAAAREDAASQVDGLGVPAYALPSHSPSCYTSCDNLSSSVENKPVRTARSQLGNSTALVK